MIVKSDPAGDPPSKAQDISYEISGVNPPNNLNVFSDCGFVECHFAVVTGVSLQLPTAERRLYASSIISRGVAASLDDIVLNTWLRNISTTLEWSSRL